MRHFSSVQTQLHFIIFYNIIKNMKYNGKFFQNKSQPFNETFFLIMAAKQSHQLHKRIKMIIHIIYNIIKNILK